MMRIRSVPHGLALTFGLVLIGLAIGAAPIRVEASPRGPGAGGQRFGNNVRGPSSPRRHRLPGRVVPQYQSRMPAQYRAPARRLYLPPARTYYAPPATYHPPMI
jgi:hypothetical protein